ncbi:hypothetical protein G6F59_018891 [Rhizopus arrhizus]|nr:hypothetical protein G6F59_018891 [Rhizopus arrhizus]
MCTRPARRSLAAICWASWARVHGGNGFHHALSYYLASPQAKGAPEAVRVNGMVDDGRAPRQTGMYAWML